MKIQEILFSEKMTKDSVYKKINNLNERITALEAETVEKPVYLTQSEFDSLAQTEPETTYFIIGE